MINWFQSNFLLNLSCHHGLADGEHQKEDFAQADFLLRYHQGAGQDLQEQANDQKVHTWSPFSHCWCPRASRVPPSQQPWTAACSLPGTARALGGLGDGLKEMVLAARGVFRLLARREHLEENIKKGLFACAAEDWGSVC